ncbi:helix-turn-helix transcriptional regulator [Leucobacter denitrificans]|uniref:Helix-turn-helix domain-containing protein n=1 Tax=Leucobacter denitrificans TaxID=683042 RepID=A0A7G9S5S5_9MICO|nr:helix-turn-helix transcriptional regulator [Leucobacter denitrificans]QNN63200.1 helix-turn-helix domain-containing protein [Leucobacter denitrificans]
MIRPRTPRGIQLGEFLAARRKAQRRVELGLPPGTRRGDIGLSREEVAALAGMSVSWYTWLEQGREINASRQVLAAVARVLQLNEAETEYVFALAVPGANSNQLEPAPTPDHLTRLVRALPFPAFVIAGDWTIVAWNARYEWLYESISAILDVDRNLLKLIYTDPKLKEMLPDWQRDSRRFLAEFRADSGVRLSSERHREVVQGLIEESPDFRAQWAEHSVERFKSRLRTFVHPQEGELVFEHHRLVPSDASDLHVIMYVPTSPLAISEETASVES